MCAVSQRTGLRDGKLRQKRVRRREKRQRRYLQRCMDFELGGMQPLVKAMPEVMLVSSLLTTCPKSSRCWRRWSANRSPDRRATPVFWRDLADVVAALIVRGWVECGCGNATGWVQVLRDPKLAKAIYAMHQQPGVNWKVEDLAREAGTSRSVFAERFLAATGTTPARYLTELRMRLAAQYISDEGQPLEKVAFRLGYSSLAAFSRAFKRITGKAPGRSVARRCCNASHLHTGLHPTLFLPVGPRAIRRERRMAGLNRRGSQYTVLQLLCAPTAFDVKI
jgi:AraC-like DNA-binding protein